ncbi:MAG TPA: CHAT domain-containing protein [Mycobacteriales bacterium]|nr:CHAT domain-containing protein [Mycobacteriales bacterium]
MPARDLTGEARALLRLVDRTPREAEVRALRLLAVARRQGDDAAAAVAGRVAGLSAVHLNRLDSAVVRLEAAQEHGRAAGRTLAAEAGMSLAFALARRGDGARALRTVSQAVSELTGVARARALVQRGAIAQQFEQLDAALADYRAALPALREAGEWVWVQRVYTNRAVLYVYRGQLEIAHAELTQAERLCTEHGLDLQLAFVVENLAFLHVRRGDVPAALRCLDDAERRHAALGASAGTVLLDRSELLLSVGLAGEARGAAEQAVAELSRTRRYSARPQAQLLLAEACLVGGDLPAARRAAAAAAASFRSQQRSAWAALARQASARCRLADPDRPGPTAQALAKTAAALEEAGWSLAALDSRLLAARAALERGAPGQARALLALSTSPRGRLPVELRVRAWHAEALLRLAEGRPAAALSALRSGVRLVEEHQATLGASDLRSSVTAHRTDLVDLGLELCLKAGRARDVLGWAERGRATALLTRPLQPPADPALAQHLVELRGALAGVDEARQRGRPAQALLRRQATIERAVRDRARQVPGSAARVDYPRVAALASALGDRALVEYVEHRGQLSAVTVVAGRVRLTPLGSTRDVVSLLDHVPLALSRLTRGTSGERSVAAARQLLATVGTRLSALLLDPLLARLGDRRLVVVPSRALSCLPWSLLPGCAGRALTVSPSAALWHRASLRPPRAGPVTVIAGPGLPAAESEAAMIGDVYRDADVLLDTEATVPAVMAALSAAGTAHIAAHGHFRADNPQFSYLRLADGPMTVYDLESLEHVPALVVLAACDTARTSVCLGNEVLGLAAAFLGMGTSALIASLVPVADAAVAPLMVSLHERLRRGASPATALDAVQAEALGSGSPAQVAAALGLVCLGADHPALPRPRAATESTGRATVHVAV